MSTTDRFERLVAEHSAIIFKICYTHCNTPSDREDLAQDIAVQLWRSFGSFDGRSSFATWMYRVALNVAISFRRREGRRVQIVGLPDAQLLNVPATGTEPPEPVRRIYDFIEQLSALDRAVMLLYLDGFRAAEISEIVGLSETNVTTKI